MSIIKLDPPAGFRVARYQAKLLRTAPMQRGAFNMVEHRLDYGGDLWTAEWEIARNLIADGSDLFAWCECLMDTSAVARLYSPLGADGRQGNSSAATLTTRAAVMAGARNVPVAGGVAGESPRAGSYLSIDDRMYLLRQTVTFDADGKADLGLSPRIRSAVNSGATIQCAEVRSLWRLNEPVEFNRSGSKTSGPVVLSLSEARV